jgi:hypothetical protein
MTEPSPKPSRSTPRKFGLAIHAIHSFCRWFATLLWPTPNDRWPGLEEQIHWRDSTHFADADAERRALAIASEDHTDALAAYKSIDERMGSSLQTVGIVAAVLGAGRAMFPRADDAWIAIAFALLALSAAWLIWLRRPHVRRLRGPLPRYLVGLPKEISQRDAWDARSLYVMAWRQRQFNRWLATRSTWATLPLAGAIVALAIGALRAWLQSS